MLNDDLMMEFVLYPDIAATIRKGAQDAREQRNAMDAKRKPHEATDGSGQVSED